MSVNNFLSSGFSFSNDDAFLKFRYASMNVVLSVVVISGFLTSYYYHTIGIFDDIYLPERNFAFALLGIFLIFLLRRSLRYYNLALFIILAAMITLFTHSLFFQTENTSILFWYLFPILFSFYLGNRNIGLITSLIVFAILFFYMFQSFVPRYINEISVTETVLIYFLATFFIHVTHKNHTRNILAMQSHQQELQSLNESLDHRIKQEVEKNQEKLSLMTQQSRFGQMGELINMLAHQWRQPLSAVSASTANLLLQIKLNDYDPEKFASSLYKIDTYVQNLSTTIEDFRNYFTSSEALQETSFKEILNDILNIIGDTFKANNISIDISIDDDAKLFLYKNEVIQALLNIFTNAHDAFKSRKIGNPKLRITSSLDDQNVVLTLSDNAQGIETEILPHIFDPYFSTKSNKNGTGLGLYLSKMIIEEKCQGTLRAENIKDGASFTVTLPRLKP